ncbi:hypothetical protein GCM10027589_42840 [Actinocorallia lasiicapitis]
MHVVGADRGTSGAQDGAVGVGERLQGDAADTVADRHHKARLLQDLTGDGRGVGLARFDPSAGDAPPAEAGRSAPPDQEKGAVPDDHRTDASHPTSKDFWEVLS